LINSNGWCQFIRTKKQKPVIETHWWILSIETSWGAGSMRRLLKERIEKVAKLDDRWWRSQMSLARTANLSVSSEQISVYTKVINENGSILLRSKWAKENLSNKSQYSRPKIRMLIFGRTDPYSSQSDITEILPRVEIVQWNPDDF
jgi:hypothetical protein